MPDTVFRTQAPEPAPEAPKAKEPGDTKVPGGLVDIESPYLDYEAINGQPYLVEHYKLGDTWQEPVGGFPEELSVIQDYVENEIKTGKMGNDVTSVKNLLKKAEKMTNTKEETRLTVKLPIIAAYMKFLMEEDKIKFNAQRYAH